jgi:hypothetical protein
VTVQRTQEEVEQRPELVQVVLERSAGDEEAVARVEKADDLGEDGVDVLDAMRLVDDDVLPRQFLERRLLALADLVGGDADVKVLGEDPIGDELFL